MKGLVIKNTGFWYTVLTNDGATIDCKVKGNFRLKGIRSTNPIAVGDRVEVSEDNWITSIEDRKNYVIRKSTNLSKQSSIIAANVDQAMLIVTINYPETSTTFIDRFLASAEAYRIPVVLVFNKTDLLDEDELRYLGMMQDLYSTVGYESIAVSATEGTGMEELKSRPGANLRTAAISDAHNQGTHTTTFSEMLALPCSTSKNDSFIIDSPGIRGFGTFDIEKEELTSYFKEIFRFSQKCRFSNCTHTHEPGCAVLKAVEDHYIALSRYNSYLSMLDDKDEDKYRKGY